MTMKDAKRGGNDFPCVYKLTFPDGSFYVGQCHSLRSRVCLYEKEAESEDRHNPVMVAVREYGIDNVRVDVLAAPQNLDKEDMRVTLAILEIKYIRECKACEGAGLNRAAGGEILGIPDEFINTDGTIKRESPVLVYNLLGELIDEYPSLSACEYHLGLTKGTIAAHIDKNFAVAGKYIFKKKKYGKVIQNIEPYRAPERRAPKYDALGEHVVFESRGWSSLINDFKVAQFTKKGDKVAEFASIKEASKSTGISYSSIWACIFGRGKSAHGFVWRKCEISEKSTASQ